MIGFMFMYTPRYPMVSTWFERGEEELRKEMRAKVAREFFEGKFLFLAISSPACFD